MSANVLGWAIIGGAAASGVGLGIIVGFWMGRS